MRTETIVWNEPQDDGYAVPDNAREVHLLVKRPDGAETKRIVGMWWRGSGRWLDAYTGDYIAPAFVLGWADMPKGWA